MLSSPYFVLILILYALGLIFLFLGLFVRKIGWLLPILSLLFFISASMVGLLTGMTLLEMAVAAAIFLVVSLFGIGRKMR